MSTIEQIAETLEFFTLKSNENSKKGVLNLACY